MATSRRVPDLPDVVAGDARQLQTFLERVREILQTGEGRRGPPLERYVKHVDLIDVGLTTLTPSGSIAPAPGTPGAPRDLSPPPAASFVGVTPGFSTIFVEWEAPVYRQGGGHAYTEVWAAQYGGTGPLPVFGDATLVSKEVAPIYAYPAGLEVQVHFWLINRSLADVPQVTPTGGLNGQYAKSAGMDIDYALELIAGANANAPLWSAAEAVTLQEVRRITGVDTKVLVCKQAGTTGGTAPSIAGAVGTMVTDGTVKWQIASTTVFAVLDAPTTINGVTLPAGAYIDAAYVSNATIQTAQIANLAVDNAKIANLSVAKLLAGNLQVGSYIYSSSYVPATSGWAINADGTCEFNTGTFRGALAAATGTFAGSLSAATGSFAGSLSSATGTFTGSLTVGSAPSVSGTTMTGSGAVFNSGGTWAAGNSTTNISFNGTTLTLNGNVVGTGNIQASAITSIHSASGTSATVSTSVTVPTGETHAFVILGFQDGYGSDSNPGTPTLGVYGATATGVVITTLVDNGDSFSTYYYVSSMAVSSAAQLSAGTHTFNLSGTSGKSKVLSVLRARR